MEAIPVDYFVVFSELEAQLGDEFDFVKEALAMDRIGDALAIGPDGQPCTPPVATPRPVANLVTRRVLVMDYFRGEPLSRSIEAMRARGIDPDSAEAKAFGRKLLSALTEACGRTILGTGFFHADPHPGNIFVLDDGRIGLIDFGQVCGTVEGWGKGILGGGGTPATSLGWMADRLWAGGAHLHSPSHRPPPQQNNPPSVLSGSSILARGLQLSRPRCSAALRRAIGSLECPPALIPSCASATTDPICSPLLVPVWGVVLSYSSAFCLALTCQPSPTLLHQKPPYSAFPSTIEQVKQTSADAYLRSYSLSLLSPLTATLPHPPSVPSPLSR